MTDGRPGSRQFRRVCAFLATVSVAAVTCCADEPAKAAKGDAVVKDGKIFNGKDLAGWRVVDQVDFEKHGKVEVVEGEIILGKGSPATGIAYTGKLPRINYEVSLDARRIEGSDFFCGMTVPVGKSYVTLILGGWGGGVTGLSNLDGFSADENETSGYTEFKQNQWYHVRLRVTEKKIEAWLDDEQIVDVDTPNHKFSIWWEQEPVRPLGIASWRTKAGLRNIQLKLLDDTGAEAD